MEKSYLSPNLDSLDADSGLWHLLDSHGEVEGARKPQSLEQCHHHKHLAGCNPVVKEIIGDEGDKNHDFADSEKWCQIPTLEEWIWHHFSLSAKNDAKFIPLR